jgi:hypothetical protein
MLFGTIYTIRTGGAGPLAAGRQKQGFARKLPSSGAEHESRASKAASVP